MLHQFICQSCKLPGFEYIEGKKKIVPTNWKIYYKIMNYTDDVGQEHVARQVDRAFDLRQRYFNPIKFAYTEEEDLAHIKVFFGNEFAPFPFEDTTLAYVPSNWPLQHNMYMNDDRLWGTSHSIYIVIAHELGHVFWFGHSNILVSLMYAIYQLEWKMTKDVTDFVTNLYKSVRDVATKQYKVSDIIRKHKHAFANSLTVKLIKLIMNFYKIDTTWKTKVQMVEIFCDFLDSNFL